MTITNISVLPEVPSRSNPSNFSAVMDAFLAAFPQFRNELNQFGLDVLATASAVNFNSISTTSFALATGAKTFTVPAGKAYAPGQWVNIAATLNLAAFAEGYITAYNATTGQLDVQVVYVSTTGTYTSWSIALGARAGSYAALTGAAFTGPVSNTTYFVAPTISAATSGAGSASLLSGGAGYSGFLGFYTAGGTRLSYIGTQATDGDLQFVSENGYGYAFNSYIKGGGLFYPNGANAQWYLYQDGSANPNINFDADDYLAYNRASNFLELLIGGVSAFKATPTKAYVAGAEVAVLTGAQTLNSKNLTNAQFNGAGVSSVVGTAPLSFNRARLNFDGTTTTPTVRAGDNVGTLTDLGTGHFRANFSTAFADTGYTCSSMCDGTAANYGSDVWIDYAAPPTVSGFTFYTGAGGAGVFDAAYTHITFAR